MANCVIVVERNNNNWCLSLIGYHDKLWVTFSCEPKKDNVSMETICRHVMSGFVSIIYWWHNLFCSKIIEATNVIPLSDHLPDEINGVLNAMEYLQFKKIVLFIQKFDYIHRTSLLVEKWTFPLFHVEHCSNDFKLLVVVTTSWSSDNVDNTIANPYRNVTVWLRCCSCNYRQYNTSYICR